MEFKLAVFSLHLKLPSFQHVFTSSGFHKPISVLINSHYIPVRLHSLETGSWDTAPVMFCNGLTWMQHIKIVPRRWITQWSTKDLRVEEIWMIRQQSYLRGSQWAFEASVDLSHTVQSTATRSILSDCTTKATCVNTSHIESILHHVRADAFNPKDGGSSYLQNIGHDTWIHFTISQKITILTQYSISYGPYTIK